ncbi:large ribosomal subunit protein mL62 [Prorops nasuta]|uniref:large ribosomal subunit protein mL62 n=1 Tax=Prorops nasuta TaxID=863751 RepID=UPI0034CFC979
MNCLVRRILLSLRTDSLQPRYLYALQNSFSYKSAVSLDKLYPKSSLKIYTPTFVPADPSAKFNGFIPIDQLDITYSTSSGPGGQNVNRVNTKVDLRFKVETATWLCDEAKQKLQDQEKNRINKEGYLIIKSDITRSQQLNLADALEKLRAMIRKSLQPPPELSEETLETIRNNKIKAARKRLYEKRVRSDIKKSRNPDINDLH